MAYFTYLSSKPVVRIISKYFKIDITCIIIFDISFFIYKICDFLLFNKKLLKKLPFFHIYGMSAISGHYMSSVGVFPSSIWRVLIIFFMEWNEYISTDIMMPDRTVHVLLFFPFVWPIAHFCLIQVIKSHIPFLNNFSISLPKSHSNKIMSVPLDWSLERSKVEVDQF